MRYKVTGLEPRPIEEFFFHILAGEDFDFEQYLKKLDTIYYFHSRKGLKMIGPCILDYWFRSMGRTTDFIRPVFLTRRKMTLHYIGLNDSLYNTFEEAVGADNNYRFTEAGSLYWYRKRGKAYTFNFIKLYAEGWGYACVKAI